jgi:ribosomal protein S18 acetylase RimI-like enzyme
MSSRGIGSRILADLLTEAQSAGVAVRLTVIEVNPARALYERHGFQLIAT